MTNNPRIFLWIALALALYLNYEAWIRDYHSPAAVAQQQAREQAANGGNSLGAAIPQASTGATTATTPPAAATTPPPEAAGSAAPPQATPGPEAAASAARVHVRTDVLDTYISLQGGTIVQTDLTRYPKVKGETEPVRLQNQDGPQTLYLLQTGLMGPANAPRPTHLANFSSPQTEYTLKRGDGELRVPLTWTDGQGVTVQKTYIFKPGSYRIDIEQTVRNQSNAPWQAGAYAQILRNDPQTDRSMFQAESYAFHGPAIFDGEKYRKLDPTDSDDRQLAVEVKNGWISALQHHFVSAVVPPKDTGYRITLNGQENQYLLAAAGPLHNIAPGATETMPMTLFIGPKLQAQLENTGPRLELVADYGKLTILAKPLFWLLDKVHNFFGNWGWAIVIVTFLLKLVFYPLSETSGRSMAKMKLLAPRIKNLQETYKDDREKLGRAMMELYQREKINPVAGCLPIIIQIPVFLAFYWVLLESVEMRQAPFMGWINDLSSRDPFFILPAIMAGAMFLQYKLQPTPADPIQAKVFMIMPLAMSVMFAFFPAGLVLYWVTNTVLSIAQQWNINRRIEAGKKATSS
jgi:YidC/Oxa1 family membrane protein insertase